MISGYVIEKKFRNVIAAGVIGNSLEFYDYTLFGYYAAFIAKVFFPSDNFFSALLATYGVFAAGFIMRPLGALFFGRIGDTQGRKKALELSILMMAVPTLIIGLLPGYAYIGIMAPVLLTLLRLIQGVSVGGEIVGSFSYIVEHAPEHRRAYFGSWSLVGIFGGKLIASIVATLLSFMVSENLMESWLWRLPFIFGLVFAFMGYRIRAHATETPVFQSLKAKQPHESLPFWPLIMRYRIAILQAIGVTMIHTVGLYFIFIYMPVYLKTVLQVPYGFAMASTTIALLATVILLPVGGYFADIYGRKPFLFYGSIALTLLSYPCFSMMNSGSGVLMLTAHLVMASAYAFLHAPLSVFYVELFPAEVRYRVSAIAYNLCICIFGGMTPFICTWLVAVTRDGMVPIYWLILCGLVSSLAASALKEKQREVFTGGLNI